MNRLNSPVTRKRFSNWILKQNPILYCIQETHLSHSERLKIKGQAKAHQVNYKKAETTSLLADQYNSFFKSLQRIKKATL